MRAIVCVPVIIPAVSRIHVTWMAGWPRRAA